MKIFLNKIVTATYHEKNFNVHDYMTVKNVIST